MSRCSFRSRAGLAILTCGLLSACGGGGSSSSTATNADSAPTVDAGSDQSVVSGDAVTLTATVTDDGATTISWTQTAGDPVSLSSDAEATVTFTAPAVSGDNLLTFEVTVDDGVNAPATDTVTIDVNEAAELSVAFLDFGANVTVTKDGNDVVLEATGRPDHTSCYWDPSNASGLYVDCDPDVTTVSRMSPGFIEEYDNLFTLRAPLNPIRASTTTATSLGPVGLAVSGAPIFNDQEGPNVALETGVISGFDRNGAHTGPSTYHYHLEPKAITDDDDALVGIIADGFLLYGRKCWATASYPTDLDASGGHTGFTQHTGTLDGDEIYHYHIMNDLYLNAYYLLFPEDYQGTPANISG